MSACDCIEQIDKQTTEKNYLMKKESFINMNKGEITWKPVLYSTVIKKKRGFKAPYIPLQYCPFCGLCANEDQGRITTLDNRNFRIYLKAEECKFAKKSKSLYTMIEVVKIAAKTKPCLKDFDIKKSEKSYKFTLAGYQIVAKEKLEKK